MKKTQVIAIMDRSGSMYGLIGDMVGAFNDFIKDLRKDNIKSDITLVSFDTIHETVFDKISTKDIKELTTEMVKPRGGTALYDAIGTAVSRAKDSSKTIVMVLTDGYENSSKEYTCEAIKKLIKEKESIGWQFNFVGAGIDAFPEAAAIGISISNTIQVAKTKEGMADTRSYLSSVTTAYANNTPS